MSGADRVRKFKERKAAGKIIVQIELDEFKLVEMLKDEGFLLEYNEHIKKSVEEALTRFMNAVLADEAEFE